MSAETKKLESELTPDELDGVAGGLSVATPPGPPERQPRIGIGVTFEPPPDPDKIAQPPGPPIKI